MVPLVDIDDEMGVCTVPPPLQLIGKDYDVIYTAGQHNHSAEATAVMLGKPLSKLLYYAVLNRTARRPFCARLRAGFNHVISISNIRG